MMQFVLKGFTPDTGFRVFNFDGIGEQKSRTEFTVRIDLALSRKHGIQMQDLPLLCRGLLDRLDEDVTARHFVFGEEEMQGLTELRAVEKEAAAKKKAARKHPANNGGGAWRGTPLPSTLPPALPTAVNLQAKESAV